MATSGNSNYTVTRDEIIKRSLRQLGVLAQGETPTTDQVNEAAAALNGLVKAWQADGMPLWAIKTYEMPLQANKADYTIGIGVGMDVPIAKPLKVYQAWLHDINSKIDIPMRLLTKQEYNILGNKTTLGMPIQAYYEPLRDDGIMHVFPMTDSTSATQKTMFFVYQRPFEDFDSATDSPDFPQEWYDAVTYGLSTRLAPEYGIPASDRKVLWQEMTVIKQEALNFGLEEGSLYFQRDNRTW